MKIQKADLADKLKNMKASEWKDEYCQLQREPIQQVDEDENLPF